MKIKFISKLRDVNNFLIQSLKTKADIIALILIAVAITLSSITPLSSGGKLNYDDDFFLIASKHEAVRKAILEYHTFPLRSFWFGGGYPTLGDPEDPTLNPLTLITIIFGSVMGLKVISFVTMLISGLSTYALARYILGYTKWGSLFSGLTFGLSLFVPLRIANGDYNDICPAFLPLCLLLIGLACRGRKIALLILSFVFYTMLSDGKQMALMVIFYIGILCILDIIPVFDTFGKSHSSFRRLDSPGEFTEEQIPKNINIKPVKVIILALIVTFFIGMVRFLPVFDLMSSNGGLAHIGLPTHAKIYTPDSVDTYTYQQFWQQIFGWEDFIDVLTIGWLPVLLSLIAFYKFRRQSFLWGVNLFLFVWLFLGHNAPIDLLKLLWNLPVFNTINKPYKYFSAQIVFTFAIVAGQFFWLLAKMRPKWLKHIVAVVLIVLGIWFQYPKVEYFQNKTYTFDMLAELLIKQDEFYNVQGKDLVRNRKEPLNSITYTNLIRNIGTVDWYTGIPIAENAIPKYFINDQGYLMPNYKYQGEAYFVDSSNSAKVFFRPNSIIIQVKLHKPDTLIINQNYHRDWHTDYGKIFDKNGLIALQLDEAGTYNITMRYISRSFYFGLMISILSLAMVIFVCWSYKMGRLAKWSVNTPVSVRWVPRFILWLID